MARVVDNHVNATSVIKNLINPGGDGYVVHHIDLDHSQIDVVLAGALLCGIGFLCIVAADAAHGGIDGVTCVSQGVSPHLAKAA